MKSRPLLVLLVLGLMTSVGYAMGSSGSADLAPADDLTNNLTLVKSGVGNIPGGNAFDGAGALPDGVQPLVVAVPEPSTMALVCLGVLGGVAATRIRRRVLIEKS